jgi:hypothetical protein
VDYLKLNGIRPSLIKNICDYFKISAYDLMNNSMDGSSEGKMPMEEGSLSNEENDLLHIYNSWSPEDKKLLSGILNKFR